MKRYKETPEEAASRTGPSEPQLELARSLFERIAGLGAPPDMVNKTELGMANRGKADKTAEEMGSMDTNRDGEINMVTRRSITLCNALQM